LQRERDEAFKGDDPVSALSLPSNQVIEHCQNLFIKAMDQFSELETLPTWLRSIGPQLDNYLLQNESGLSAVAKVYINSQKILASELLQKIGETNAIREKWYNRLKANGHVWVREDLYNIEDQINVELDALEGRYNQEEDMTENQRIASTSAIGMSRNYGALCRKTLDLLDQVMGDKFGHNIPARRVERQNYYMNIYRLMDDAHCDPESFVRTHGADHDLPEPVVWNVRATIARSIRGELKRDLEQSMKAYIASYPFGNVSRSSETWAQVYNKYYDSATEGWKEEIERRVPNPAESYETFFSMMNESPASLAKIPPVGSSTKDDTTQALQ